MLLYELPCTYEITLTGHGSMGISNSIGSNTFDILLCLGLPWLIKASFLPTTEGQHFVGINSRGLEYSAISLLSTLLLLYATFSCNKFQLDRKVGQACLIMYGMFLVLASLIELNVFFMEDDLIVTGTLNRCLWILTYQALCQAIQEDRIKVFGNVSESITETKQQSSAIRKPRTDL
ncbi:hypothetical protein Cfor_08276 [Coptotermes formosanus]|uniref:Sodium/calcium exchanger membrane region domain-containing protein n=1 Tax=Coptotermes formosanus TaxID=36987 RepID=A0A6L2PV97_COPFO|nr:hypothetical protein Cfor_08276 [Coptotermes formosanus]